MVGCRHVPRIHESIHQKRSPNYWGTPESVGGTDIDVGECGRSNAFNDKFEANYARVLIEDDGGRATTIRVAEPGHLSGPGVTIASHLHCQCR